MAGYRLERADEGVRDCPALHGGQGAVGVRHFGFGGAADPAILLLYRIPPGASEGMHQHARDHADGAFDEFYFVLSGEGVMQVDEERIPLSVGDHIHVPNGMRRGIGNRSESEPLVVYLVAMRRQAPPA